MASPPSVTIKDLTGDFVMNKTLSDDPQPVFVLQGISWVTRKAMGLATLYLNVKQYTDANGIVHIDIKPTITGGLPGTTELRTLDFQPRKYSDNIFGKLQDSARFISTDAIEHPYQKEGWIDDEAERGGPAGETHIQSILVSDAGWTETQIWGFEIVDGKRRYTRRIVVKKGDKEQKIRLVYDYK